MKGLRGELIESDEALAELEPAWWELWRCAAAATPFQSPAWLIPWWHAFRPGALFTVAIRHDDRLVALAPCYIEDGPCGRRILPLGASVSDYLDVLVEPEWSAPASHALVGEVVRHAARWDVWDLEELRPEAAAIALPCPPGCTEEIRPQSACPVLVIDPDEPFRSVPSGVRRKINLARNRAGRRGAAIHAPSPDQCREFLDDLFRLHAARWEDRGEAGVLADPAVRDFHQSAAPALLAAGLLRPYAVTIEGRVAGAFHGLHHAGCAYAYIAGFDPDFAFESPGTLLFAHAIEDAAREGAREFHLLRGQEPYKYRWGASDRWNRRRSYRRQGAVP